MRSVQRPKEEREEAPFVNLRDDAGKQGAVSPDSRRKPVWGYQKLLSYY